MLAPSICDGFVFCVLCFGVSIWRWFDSFFLDPPIKSSLPEPNIHKWHLHYIVVQGGWGGPDAAARPRCCSLLPLDQGLSLHLDNVLLLLRLPFSLHFILFLELFFTSMMLTLCCSHAVAVLNTDWLVPVCLNANWLSVVTPASPPRHPLSSQTLRPFPSHFLCSSWATDSVAAKLTEHRLVGPCLLEYELAFAS